MTENGHRVPPNDIEAEKAVLGSILQDNQQFKIVSEVINDSDFYKTEHQIIFKEMGNIKETVDYITLTSALKTAKKIEKCGGASYLISLTENVVSPVTAKQYAEIVREKSILRQAIKIGLDILNKASSPKVDLSIFLSEIQQSIVTIITRNASKMTKKTILQEVEEWLYSNTNNNKQQQVTSVSLLSCYYDLGFQTKEDKAQCRVAFKRLCEKGVLEPQGGRSAMYRLINSATESIDYLNAEDEPFEWHCPLKTHELVNIYPGSIILIAGESNAGKTSYCLNVAKHYKQDRPVYYFSSEMEDIELKARLKKFGLPLEDWKNVRFVQRHSNFQEVVKPDQLNIVDYLEVHKDFYEVSGLIRNIKDKIGRGIAIIAIQKPPGRDAGVGGENTKNLARLYISMSPGKAKIVKGKMWASIVNPDGMAVEFKLVGGAHFQVKNRWEKETKTPF